MESRKKNISLRLSQRDIEGVQQIAARLGVKESDVFRFAVKGLLSSLASFREPSCQGRDLMPALIENGKEMVSFFEIDANQLIQLVNGDVEDGQHRVDVDDLKLLALASSNERHAMAKLESKVKTSGLSREALGCYLSEKYIKKDAVRSGSLVVKRKGELGTIQ